MMERSIVILAAMLTIVDIVQRVAPMLLALA